MKPVFHNMEAERARHGQTSEDVAAYLGITRRTYLNWMNGKSEIPCSAIIKLAQLWQTTADYLLGLTDYPHEMTPKKEKEKLTT